MRGRLVYRALPVLLAWQSACQTPGSDPRTHSAAPARAAGALSATRKALLCAEQRRDSSAIGSEALSSRDVAVRRDAARALARIADARAAELLPLALTDEDPEVSTWGAYGLGYACRGREAKIVRALAARAASLPMASAPGTSKASLFSPIEAISDALGRCGGTEAEATLRAWLRGPPSRAEAAALALGRLVERSGRLEDASLVGLLDAADRAEALQNALYPFTRLAQLNGSTSERLLSLGLKLISNRAPGAEFAVRALGHTGDAGSAALGKLLGDATVSSALRAQAVRELATQGSAAQRPLWAAFDGTVSQGPSDAELLSDSYGAFSALLDALQPPALSAGVKLHALAQLTLGNGDSASLSRRKVHVRCTSAALIAGADYQNAHLLACDPALDSPARELAVLAVLGRGKLSGRRKQAYLQRASSPNAALREAALELLGPHAELAEAYRVLADALAAKELGVVASAARVLSGYPERAGRVLGADAHDAPKPDPSVVQALAPAYAAAGQRHSVEVQSLLLDAIGALQVLNMKDAVNGACSSDNPTLREHAERTLHLLGEQSRRCDQFVPGTGTGTGTAPDAVTERELLTLETETGNLTITLDPALAPMAVARVTALAKAGFYDGLSVHRVVPGFVAQFGDPRGDGYGGDDQAPLRCETSPLAFLTGGVGVALSGRDTGSSQLFVTLGRYPHLDGQYAWVGQAGPGWNQIAAGDRILHARVATVPR
ncbi:MAG: peptidylprolyl isomerase [Pseudomonadota bacterium]